MFSCLQLYIDCYLPLVPRFVAAEWITVGSVSKRSSREGINISSFQHLGLGNRMLSESFSTYAQSAVSFIQQNKLSSLILLCLPLFYYAYLDYQGWYALGAGGIPHNIFGWLVQSLLRLRASRNVRDPSCYHVAMRDSELERTQFLDNQLPAWTGNAPKTGVWVAPHRQLEQFPSADIRKVPLLVSKESHDTMAQNLYMS